MKTQQGFKVAVATPEDAESICRVLADTQIATYPNPARGVTEEVLRDFHYKRDGSVKPDNLKWTAKHNATLPGSNIRCVYTARVDDEVVGVGSGTLYRGERRLLRALYVRPDFQRRGIGPALLDRVLDWHKDHGNEDVYLKVVEYNKRAIGFYVNSGFEEVGPVPENDRWVFSNGVVLPQIEMVKRARQLK